MDGLFNYAKYAQKPKKGALRQKAYKYLCTLQCYDVCKLLNHTSA